MTRQEAIKKAQRLWGKKAIVRAGERCSSQDERDGLIGKIRELRQARKEIADEINRRLAETP